MKRLLPVIVGLAMGMVPPATAGPARPAGSDAAVGSAAASPQFGDILKRAQQIRELTITEDDEIRLGDGVSQKVRARYGVVQDAAVHRYVTLVGAVLADASSRPGLPWKFIVLDTDGVNAFAAPGGYIHITRGALGLLNSEAELADVLAHEIIHVTAKHTVKAVQKSKAVQMGADETLADKKVFQQLVDHTSDLVMAGFGRAEELESDKEGIRLANRVGYSPSSLGAFLTRLTERNKSASEKQGLFASHPEMQERLDRLSKQIGSEKLASTATLEDRYRKFISYKTKGLTDITAVQAGSAGLAGGGKSADDKKKEEQPKKRGFGLGDLVKPTGSEKKSAEVTGSGASRGVDTERNARGGAVPTMVVVSLKPSDIAAFKKEGNLR
ncbi:MAG TPA: M48 family metalloprotease [Vicinamibacterales bacterium]|jgi:predicted Zn-dependent protease